MDGASTGSATQWVLSVRVSILCTDSDHPVIDHLRKWAADRGSEGHAVSIFHDKAELPGGDLLFLVSCSQLIREPERKKYAATLVLHASPLPKGRGWSPHVWSILGGASEITVCLLEADEPVDSGAIWNTCRFSLEGHELLNEINERLFATELSLMTQALGQFGKVKPVPQEGEAGPYMPKRSPADSRLDPHRSIAEQFDLLRVVDSQRYPAHFEFRGKRYIIKIEKDENGH